MALTKGMLERFSKLASKEDKPLLKVSLSAGEEVFGYVREVGDDFFVVEEVKKVGYNKSANDRYARGAPVYEYTIKKAGQTTLGLDLIKSWSEIPEDELPSIIGGISI